MISRIPNCSFWLGRVIIFKYPIAFHRALSIIAVILLKSLITAVNNQVVKAFIWLQLTVLVIFFFIPGIAVWVCAAASAI